MDAPQQTGQSTRVQSRSPSVKSAVEADRPITDRHRRKPIVLEAALSAGVGWSKVGLTLLYPEGIRRLQSGYLDPPLEFLPSFTFMLRCPIAATLVNNHAGSSHSDYTL